MIYIVTALYPEAKPWIEYFQLKKRKTSSKFQIFQNEDITLIISGIGVLSSSTATAHLLTVYHSSPNDTVFNIGIAGAVDNRYDLGETILCHKITLHETKESYYPDVLLSHDFKEGVLESFLHPVSKNQLSKVEGDLVDMEGAGFFHAASSFLPPHHIFVIKIISDFLEPEKITRELVTKTMEQSLPKLTAFIERIKNKPGLQQEILSETEINKIAQISRNLHLTITMQHQLVLLVKQYKIRTNHSLDWLQPFLNIQIENKHEGKKVFEQIKNKLLYS